MSTLAFSLVVLAGLIHACWNIAAKKAGGDARFSFFSSVWMALIWAPVGLWAGWSVVPRWGWVEWGFIGASAVLHVVYFIVLLRVLFVPSRFFPGHPRRADPRLLEHRGQEGGW